MSGVVNAIFHVAVARVGFWLCLALCLASCGERPSIQSANPHPDATIEHIFVATERSLDNIGPAFGDPREEDMNFLRFDVSVPPTHQIGHVEWPKGKPDAATDFVVTDTHIYNDMGSFIRTVQRQTPDRETMVFIHGYNNTLSDATYRLAQIRTDFETEVPSVLFSWPSAGDARGYIYDRDSLLFARDDLEQLLKAMTAASGEKVFLVAHSMGAHLAMEVMRQAALQGDRRLLSRISGVVLMSPDIDPDIFRRQAEAIGKLPQPFFIFTTQQDRALSLAGWLTGHKQRLGVIDGPEQVAGLDVTVLDFTQLADGEGLDHAVALTSPAAIKVLSGLRDQSGLSNTNFGRYMILSALP